MTKEEITVKNPRRWHVGAIALLLSLCHGCMHDAEPRWLVRALPGAYPEIVYFVPTHAHAVALTIDDGLDPETTPAILDVLQAHGVHATFFLVSHSIPGNEALVARILDEGHEIGNHMTQDEVTVKLSDEALAAKFHEAADVLDALGPVVWFRPGSARYDDRVLALTRAHGYRIALASVAPLDTVIHSPRTMAGFIAWMVEPGSIIVLHDVSDRGRRTAETLERLLPELTERGYSVLTLSALDALFDAGEVEEPPQSPAAGD
ncbi:MAG: polysaccharide deacetylase family protein [Pseudomonadales bacterium]